MLESFPDFEGTLKLFDTPPEYHYQLPLFFRDRVIAYQTQAAIRQCLDDPCELLEKRIDAYFYFATKGRKRHNKGDEFPTLTQLGRYLERDRSSATAMSSAVRVDRVNYNAVLCLAAIYPAPRQGQHPVEVRRQRLTAADAWLEDPSDVRLIDALKNCIDSPEGDAVPSG